MLPRRLGFTLIELLLVIAIVSIVAAISAPSLRSISSSTGLRASSKQLEGDLWFARQRAIASSTPHSLAFLPAENRYVVFRDDGGTTPSNGANGVMDAGEPQLRDRSLPQRQVLSEVDLDPENSVIFTSRGTLRLGTSGGSITIADNRGRQRAVLVMASGLTRME